MKMVKEKISYILFSIFYIGLFVLQILPSWALAFVDFNTILFWLMCGVGVVAMITQAIKFPCFTTRICNSAMIAMAILSYIMRGCV